MPIEIQFRYLRSDYVFMTLAVTHLSPLQRAYRAVFAAALPFLMIAWTIQSDQTASFMDQFKSVSMPFISGQADWTTYTVGLFLLALFAGRDFWAALIAAATFGQRVAANEIHTVSFGDDGIDYSAPNISSHIAWSVIKRLIETKRHLFLMIDNRQAIIVPHRAFADAAAYSEALAFVKSHAPRTPNRGMPG